MLNGINPIYFLIAGGGLAVVILVVGLVVSLKSEKSDVDERLDRYLAAGHVIETDNREKTAALTDWLNRKVEKSSYGDRVSKNLARADLKLKSGEYIAVIIIVAFAVGFVLFFIGGKSIVMALLGALIGSALPGMYVKSLQAKRLVKFNDQLGDMLNLMVNGLRAGYSTMQAMESVSKELPSPICDEFRRVVQEMQLGVPMERALDNLLNRIPSDDLDLIITAINVQREVGGNLAEILDTISYTIRERVRIKGEIRVLTAQVMYSGRFLSMMPLILMAILYALNREYMMEFFKDANNTPLPCGYISLGVGALLIIIGYFVMNKMGQIEV
ncbi:Flp pilus assembly protein TadB [Longilinea arvoryzae]|uniref:Flp pilus assembly protein TadB n=1 Tax=Longilinea arvoryzae TaxID=360412 RepID=A0A0S7BM13_9CHLR|nr:type II secretion system F family protein [Longilinea arvoryzae]GAP14993.1 Flp pilus assembly protein TadB [Longilinea arvoryzae]